MYKPNTVEKKEAYPIQRKKDIKNTWNILIGKQQVDFWAKGWGRRLYSQNEENIHFFSHFLILEKNKAKIESYTVLRSQVVLRKPGPDFTGQAD